MGIKDYLAVLCRRMWIVILVPLIATGVSAFMVFFVLEPVYESTTTLYIVDKKFTYPASTGYEDAVTVRQLIKDYNEIIKSRTVIKSLINSRGLSEISPEKMAQKINLGLKGDTGIIEIRVEDTAPERAKMLADSVRDIFIKKISELMDVGKINILDRAEVPYKPVRPKPAIVIVTFFAGLLGAVCLVFFLDYLDDTIKTREDVEKCLGLMVLASIPLYEENFGGQYK
jgi:capsular polysaccharide biosynthesis protein